MATALDIITLAEAKALLAIDFPDHDATITSLIHTAVALVEAQTSHKLYQRDEKRYIRTKADIYDYPLKVVSVADTTGEIVPFKTLQFTLYTDVTVFQSEPVEATLTVGYVLKTDIPAPLLEAVKKLIVHLFAERTGMPMEIYMLIRPYVRYASI